MQESLETNKCNDQRFHIDIYVSLIDSRLQENVPTLKKWWKYLRNIN